MNDRNFFIIIMLFLGYLFHSITFYFQESQEKQTSHCHNEGRTQCDLSLSLATPTVNEPIKTMCKYSHDNAQRNTARSTTQEKRQRNAGSQREKKISEGKHNL